MADVPALASVVVSSQNSTILKPDYSKVLTLDYENEVPFTTFMGQVPQEVATGSQFNFFVGRRIPRQCLAASSPSEGGSAGDSISLAVTSGYGKYFSIGDLVYAPASTSSSTVTNKYIVSAISTDTLTLYPNNLLKKAGAIASGATIYRFSASIKEGSSGRAPIQTVPTLYTNNIHTYEDYGRVNMQVQDSETWTVEKELARIRREKRLEHIQNQEAGSLFSEKSLDTTVLGSTGNPRYTQDGAFTIVQSNLYAYGSSMTQSGLYGLMSTVHKPGFSAGNMRYVFASIGAMSEFNKLFISAMRLTPAEGEMTWKVNFTQITYLGFTWKFILTPSISQYYPGAALVVAPKLVSRKVLHATEFKDDVSNRKDNFIEPGWVSCNGLKLPFEEHAALITP